MENLDSDRFVSLMATTVDRMEDSYRRAQQHAREKDSQRAGHEGEAVWTSFIREWLPGWPVVTRKYIVGPHGSSNEVDLVILKKDYPLALRDEASVLISGVAAAFSCKLTMTTADISEAIEQKRRINAILGDSQDFENGVAGAVPFGLLANATSLSLASEGPSEDLAARYEALAHNANAPAVHRPAEELDAVVVANCAFLNTTYMAVSIGQYPEMGLYFYPTTIMLAQKQGPAHKGFALAAFAVWLSGRLGRVGSGALNSLKPAFELYAQEGRQTQWPNFQYADHVRQHPSVLIGEYGMPRVI